MIHFSHEELNIFNIIKKYALSLESGVVPRLAGGFVRDKILNIPCSDIDIALENISGVSFANGLSETFKDQPSVHKISANPEKSKHLETAVLNIYGFSIDFVQLRSESYTHTRIPLVIPGTAKEDAERRDITINSLFYNLITEEIEDFTGRGLHDIENKIIDTPLNPRTTLFDDPLRILRIFRFKSKFGFQISSRIYEAISDEEIKEALEKKVSNERVLIEIDKMLKYENGEIGLIEIIANGYVNAVFKPPVQVKIELKSAIDFLEFKAKVLNMFQPVLFVKKHINYPILKLYTILHYFIGVQIIKKKNEYVNVCIARDSLKASREIINTIEMLERNMKLFYSLCYYSSTAFDTVKFPVLNTEDKEKLSSLDSLKSKLDPVEFVVKSGELWFESLIILYSVTFDSDIIDLIDEIFKNNWQECYQTKPIVDGDYLVSTGIDKFELKKILIDALIIQIKNPTLSREDIFSQLHLEKK